VAARYGQFLHAGRIYSYPIADRLGGVNHSGDPGEKSGGVIFEISFGSGVSFLAARALVLQPQLPGELRLDIHTGPDKYLHGNSNDTYSLHRLTDPSSIELGNLSLAKKAKDVGY